MTGNLSRCPGLNEVAGYVPPIPLAILLEAQEKQPDQRTNMILFSNFLINSLLHLVGSILATGKA
jgi:hypothetical protein